MAEYIERSDAAKYFEKSKQTMWHKDDVTAAISSKANIPTADVVEVVHAYWEKDCVTGFTACSNCRMPYPGDAELKDFYESDYCPWCGAKMDAGNKTGLPKFMKGSED